MPDLLKHQRQLLGIAKGWALKSLPGWTDECHRDLIARHGAKRIKGVLTGKDTYVPGSFCGRPVVELHISSLTMSPAQIAAALSDYEARGWPRQRNYRVGGQTKPVPPRIKRIVLLWGRLGTAGKLKRVTRPALLAFCARQTRRDVRDLDSLSSAECTAITEALKSWLARG
ncbi:MAG: regulatory protein GemA [Betaproteobacteria bacterium]|nr:regulatory protein GemA [Betaproteobacteria bacterium]